MFVFENYLKLFIISFTIFSSNITSYLSLYSTSHLCFSNYSAEYLLFGSRFNAFMIKSLPWSDICLNLSFSLSFSSFYKIICSTCCLVFPGNGVAPERSMYDITHMLQISTFSLYVLSEPKDEDLYFRLTTSGAM